jgi:hypothetical protein
VTTYRLGGTGVWQRGHSTVRVSFGGRATTVCWQRGHVRPYRRRTSACTTAKRTPMIDLPECVALCHDDAFRRGASKELRRHGTGFSPRELRSAAHGECKERADAAAR